MPDTFRAARLPEGITADQLKIVRASAIMTPIDEQSQPTEAERAFADVAKAALETAGGPAMVTNGKPTIMRVVAWMAHEGINRNRLKFIAADLEQAAAKIKAPDLLPMDFNHSAVDAWSWEEKVIGAWYEAEYALDPATNTFGILAKGMMWSWMFPRYADRLLAEQARHGKIDFSMACIASKYEEGRDADGAYEVAHEPTFFTLSALDVRPGDGAANGTGVEGSEDPQLEDKLADDLKNPATRPPVHDYSKAALLALATLRALGSGAADESITGSSTHTRALTESVRAAQQQGAESPEDGMDELLAFLKENAAKMADQATLVELTAKVEAVASAVKSSTEVAAELVVAKTELEAKTVALEGANASLTEANTTIAELNAALETATKSLATYTAKEADDAAAARLTKRLAELPEHVLKAHTALPDEQRKGREDGYTKKSDEEWAEVVAIATLVPKIEKSFLDRSRDEGGVLPTKTDKQGRLSAFRD